MFETLSNKLNQGNELAAYSWNGLEKLGKKGNLKKVLLPVMSVHTDPSVYYGFVLSCEEFMLPPLPKESLRGVYEINEEKIKEEFLRDKYFGDIEIIDLDKGAESSQKYKDLKKSKIILGNNDPFEEHGFHLPMDSDNIRSRGLIRGLERELEGVISVPSISYAFTEPYERGFYGTIKIEFETQKYLILNYFSYLVEEIKPEKVVIITSHASPTHLAAIQDGINTLRERYGNSGFMKIFDFSLLKGKNMKNGKPFVIVGHASKCETSSILAYLNEIERTGLCDLEKAKGGKVNRFRNIGTSLKDYNRKEESGVNGWGENDPKLSSFEAGKEYNQTMLSEAKRIITEWKEWE